MGVDGDIVSVWVSSSSSVVIEGVASEGATGGGASSANTRVGFGAVISQGKMGLGRSIAGGVEGTR